MSKFFIAIIFILLLAGCAKTLPPQNQVHATKTTYDFFTQYSYLKLLDLKAKLHSNINNVYTLSRNDILNLLGNPIVIKTTHNLLIWQYRNTSCSLNIIWASSKNTNDANNTSNDTLEIGDSKFISDADNLTPQNPPKSNTTATSDGYTISYIKSITFKSQAIDDLTCLKQQIKSNSTP